MTGAIAFSKAATSGQINQFARQNFLSLYPNRHKSILKPHSCKSWVTMSRHAPLSDETILEAIGLETDTIWGCRWSDQTRFAVFDVDQTSQYHNELWLARLRHLLASVGLDSPQNFQSSDSEGWHLYLPFSSWINSEEVHKTLKQWLAAEGLQIKQGQLELFPSNNGLRFPLQRGFAWLSDQGAIKLRREDITADEAIAKFVDALEANAHDWQTVQSRIATRLAQITLAAGAGVPAEELKNEDVEEDGFSAFFTQAGKIQEVYDFGRAYWQDGLTAPSQRHHAIICIGHYLWYGDENEGVRALPGIAQADRRAATIEEWLKRKHNGFSKSVLKDDWKDVSADIHRACNWEATEGLQLAPRTSYLITDRVIDRLEGLTKQTGRVWYPEDLQKGNIGREERAREQIRLALVQLIEEGRRVTVRGLERVSGCKRETIRRHVDIWGAFKLSNGPGDLSLCPVPGTPVFRSPKVQEEKKVFVSCESDSETHLDEQPSESPLVAPALESSVLELAPFCFTVFDSLRLKLFGATANNSTATAAELPSLTISLATGSNTGARYACMWVKPGELICSLNGFLPTLRAGPLHLPQIRIFSMGSSGRQSNRNCEPAGCAKLRHFHARAP